MTWLEVNSGRSCSKHSLPRRIFPQPTIDHNRITNQTYYFRHPSITKCLFYTYVHNLNSWTLGIAKNLYPAMQYFDPFFFLRLTIQTRRTQKETFNKSNRSEVKSQVWIWIWIWNFNKILFYKSKNQEIITSYRLMFNLSNL